MVDERKTYDEALLNRITETRKAELDVQKRGELPGEDSKKISESVNNADKLAANLSPVDTTLAQLEAHGGDTEPRKQELIDLQKSGGITLEQATEIAFRDSSKQSKNPKP
jgi:hypothetical protein